MQEEISVSMLYNFDFLLHVNHGAMVNLQCQPYWISSALGV